MLPGRTKDLEIGLKYCDSSIPLKTFIHCCSPSLELLEDVFNQLTKVESTRVEALQCLVSTTRAFSPKVQLATSIVVSSTGLKSAPSCQLRTVPFLPYRAPSLF